MENLISLELLDGTRNLMRYSCIKKGDNLLIHVDRLNEDPVLVQAMVIAAEEMGANVAVLKTREWHKIGERAPKIVQKAILGADVIITQGNSVYSRDPSVKKARLEYGTTIIHNEALRSEWMAAEYGRFPFELLHAIGKKVREKVERGRILRATTPKGTDISTGINPYCIVGSSRPLARPGDKMGFPGGRLGISPSEPAYGVIYADLISPGHNPPSVLLKKPLKVTIENNWAIEIEGEHADWLKELVSKDKNARQWGEIMFGIHPKAEPFGYPTVHPTIWFRSLHSRPDMLHCALGHGVAGGASSAVHCDLYQYNPTIYIDGEVLVDNGYLLVFDDPEVRELATKYGDPDKLLSLNPLPPGMFA